MDLSNIKVFRVNQLSVFINSNPLTVDEVFDIYKMIPFPSNLKQMLRICALLALGATL